MSRLEQLGGKAKFIVIKREDADKHLDYEHGNMLLRVLKQIGVGRLKDGKKSSNEYLVINLDEPYAPQIVDILKANGHWG